MDNKINIVPNRQCRKCNHKDTVYDPYFVVNGEHYYCDAVRIPQYRYNGIDYEGQCIDNYWWDDGECLYYKVKER